jgi:hypothetical protein
LFGCTFVFASFLCAAGSRKTSGRITFLLVVVASVFLQTSCGGGSEIHQGSMDTPAGAYTITVTGTSGSSSHSTSLNLVVE